MIKVEIADCNTLASKEISINLIGLYYKLCGCKLPEQFSTDCSDILFEADMLTLHKDI